MAAKSASVYSESTGTAALSVYPPSVSLSSSVLSSVLPLPPDPVIACSVFIPETSTPIPLDFVELARRDIHRRKKTTVLDSVLSSVLVDKDTQSLYVFSIGSDYGAHIALATLHFDGLTCESFY